MGQVNGFGGFFFRANDPEKLAAWYAEHLGITGPGTWRPDEGVAVFAPFAADTDYFGDPSRQWMLNFRVSDLAGLIADLQAKGIAVTTKAEWDSEIGRFARIHDPEGNPIELWEPAQT
ncbi:VOC family protein [Sulfitobacter sp. D35]|uniref:VOC family protein n=1 Tax=Sulfitobacter sp. D35 TaxID=3083252 RepID=UPI00296FFF67|nr:VOC family protein [Sulfitobacter sp. D35]MDW4499284.1 VOC family protein [Sulfitobacter sp. D35]